MPRREASSGDQLSAGRLSTKTAPVSGWYTPASSLTQVLFPAPFSPRSASTSPATRSKVTSRIAITPPNRFVADASPAGALPCAVTASPLDKVADIADQFKNGFAPLDDEIQLRPSLEKAAMAAEAPDIAIPLPVRLPAIQPALNRA